MPRRIEITSYKLVADSVVLEVLLRENQEESGDVAIKRFYNPLTIVPSSFQLVTVDYRLQILNNGT